MDHITWNYRNQPTSFDVYTEEEAISRNIPYKHWREAAVGEMCCTDDGFVVDCLRIKIYRYKGRQRRHIKTSIGEALDDRNFKLLYVPHRENNSFFSISPMPWVAKETRKTRTKNVVKVYVKQLLSGHIDYNQLGQTYRPDQKSPAATVKRLFREEVIKEMIEVELDQELKRRGLDKGFVLTTIKRAIDIAEAKEDPGTMIKGADKIADWLEMNKKESRQQPFMLEFGVTKELNGAVEAAEAELLASKDATIHGGKGEILEGDAGGDEATVAGEPEGTV